LYSTYPEPDYRETKVRQRRGPEVMPIATDDALAASRHFQGIADMKRFSALNDL
jgi:hypothetical protein